MENNKINNEERKYSRKKRYRQLNRIENILKLKFSDKSILNTALTHRSYVNEVGYNIKDNEKFEYLGDSVLALVVNEYLFKRYDNYLEGDLAKIKSAVVSEATLAKVAAEMRIGNYILMSRGEERSGGRDRPSILANTLEAIIGAIYLDSGLKASKKFVLGILKKDIERIDSLSYLRDPKTTLQEFVQRKYKERPCYEVIDEKGPDHKKVFTVKLMVHGKEMTVGSGSSKGKAEMKAAKKALEDMKEGILSI